MAQFSITAMAGDSSGWAKASAVSQVALDPLALAHSAAEKARLSHDPQEVAPGRYTVILEPAAVLDSVGQMFGDFSATAVADSRSFLTDRSAKSSSATTSTFPTTSRIRSRPAFLSMAKAWRAAN